MDVKELFKTKEAELPKPPDEGASYPAYVQRLLKGYINQLKAVDGKDYLSTELLKRFDYISQLSTRILDALSCYYGGLPHRSYDLVADGLSDGRAFIADLVTPHSISQNLEYLYRMRISDEKDGKAFRRQDLFHMPFELRHKVESRRYSIPGLPCLYLGGSSYVCWEEMERPEFSKIYIARFKAVKEEDLRVLDLGYRPELIAALIESEGDKIQRPSRKSQFVLAQATLWPIIAACSIKARIKSTHFKPEYILPQLLLQWLTSEIICDGVRYFSNNIFFYPNTVTPVSNFVFPTRKQKDKGYCEDLCSKFELSEPVSWDVITRIESPWTPVSHLGFKIQFAEGLEMSYVNTQFGEVDCRLANMETAKIDH